MTYVSDRLENILGNGENAGCIFSFSHYVFKRLPPWDVSTWACLVKG